MMVELGMCRRCVGVRNLELGMSHPRLGISTLAELRLEYLELLVKSLEFGGFTRLLMLQCPEIGINNLKVVPQVNGIPGCGLTPNHFWTSELVLAAPINRTAFGKWQNCRDIGSSRYIFSFFGWGCRSSEAGAVP